MIDVAQRSDGTKVPLLEMMKGNRAKIKIFGTIYDVERGTVIKKAEQILQRTKKQQEMAYSVYQGWSKEIITERRVNP